MNFEKISSKGLIYEYSSIVDKKTIDNRINLELEKISSNLDLPGFRKGKVPKQIVKQKYQDKVYYDLIQKISDENFNQIVKKDKLDVLNVKIKDSVAEFDKDFKIIYEIETYPNIKLPDFTKIKFEKPVLDLSKSDIDKLLKDVADNSFKYIPKKTESAKGDQVKCKLDFEHNGKKIKSFFEKEGYVAVLDDSKDQSKLFKDINKNLLKVKKGDKVSFKIKLDENFHIKEYKNQEVNITAFINEVNIKESFKLDDNLAKHYKKKNLKELENDVIKSKEEELNIPLYSLVKKRLFDALESKMDFEIPQSLIEVESKKVNDTILQQKQEEKLTKKQIDNIVIRRVKVALLLREFSKINNIKPTKDDIIESLGEYAFNFNVPTNFLFEQYNNNEKFRNHLAGPIQERAALRPILNKEIKFTEKKFDLDGIIKELEKIESY